jgi:HTH-type transcriptional regulator / antitoxin HipB
MHSPVVPPFSSCLPRESAYSRCDLAARGLPNADKCQFRRQADHAAMPTRDRPADIGGRRARLIIGQLGEELLRARIDRGLSQASVAAAAGISRSQISRIERAEVQGVSVLALARLLAVVGLELSARAYPKGSPIRDRAQLALLARFRVAIGPSVTVRGEVPLPTTGDLRAWDLVLAVDRGRIAVEAETRPRDVQALQRRVELKLRDDPTITSVVLLLADTRHNRSLMREHGPALRTDFAKGGPEILRALGNGRDPGGSGVVLM